MKPTITKELIKEATLLGSYTNNEEGLTVDDAENIPVGYLGRIFAYILSKGIKEVYLTERQYESFILNHSDMLPYDWDGKTFRGMTISIIR